MSMVKELWEQFDSEFVQARPPENEQEKFDLWWANSKHGKAAASTEATRNAAWDAWIACRSDSHIREHYRLKGGFYCGVGACLHIFLAQDSDDVMDEKGDYLVEDMAEKLRDLVKSIQTEMQAYQDESPFPKTPPS